MTNNFSDEAHIDVAKLLRIDRSNYSSDDDSDINESFINENIDTVNIVASTIIKRSKLPTGIEFNDLVSWGIEGLIKAKKKFVADKGAQFKTYSQFRIRGEILDNIRKEWGTKSPQKYRQQKERVSHKIAEYVESVVSGEPKNEISLDSILAQSMVMYMISIDDYYDEGQSLTIEDKSQDHSGDILQKEEYDTLWKTINDLENDEKEVITRFYKDNKSQKDIAIELEWSRSKVCRTHSKALDKLKINLEKEYYKGEMT